MKNSLSRGVLDLLRLLTISGVICFNARCGAQDNVWTSPASGNWQDGSWSLGILPATNQTIWLTNYGWKAVQIGAATAQEFPQSMNVDSINISSPTNSFNTLLLNYAGAATPLTVNTLSVGSNSAMSMVASGLQINGYQQGLTVGGEFDQNDSVVGGSWVNVGYIGPGIYNFNSGYFTISHLWVGGSYGGVFNQNGGTNAYGITHLDGGDYVLSNGFFGATIYFNGGQFWQEGGVLAQDLSIFDGNYILQNGIHQGGALVPATQGYSSGGGGMLQTGGTNEGSLTIGYFGGGHCTLSNGISLGGVAVGYQGRYNQYGGTLVGGISISEQQVAQYAYQAGSFNLSGGQVSANGMSMGGYYGQAGGTNIVTGDVTIPSEVEASLSLSGGLLTANNMTINPGWVGGVFQTGGTLVISNQLWIGGNGYPEWQGFQAGGQLSVSNIWVAPLAIFACRDGVIKQSGTLTLANASFYAGNNSVQLGRLCLSDGGNTNSTIYLPSPTSILSFADSRSVKWSNAPLLIVEGWIGSLYGGGQQRIIFGTNSNALTSAQVHQIQFHNPAGLAAGSYPAKILASGEIVPDGGAATPASMALSPQSGGMAVTLQGQSGQNYSIEVSTDLMHWVAWTNQTCSNGTIRVTDMDAKNCPMRFYRAKLVP